MHGEGRIATAPGDEPGGPDGRPATRWRHWPWGVVAVVLVAVGAIVLVRPEPALVDATGAAPLPGAPTGAVTERWSRPVERPVHDLLVVDDLVVLVEIAPLESGQPAGVLVTALDGADGRQRWQRRVPGRSLVVLSDASGARGVVDVAATFAAPSTIRGLGLADGGEAWTRPADGSTRIGWDGPGRVVLAGEQCVLLDMSADTEDAAPGEVPGDPGACDRAGLPRTDVTVSRGDDRWRVRADPPGPDGGEATRLVVGGDRGDLARLRGPDRVVLDPFDDQPLGGQLTGGGVLVPRAGAVPGRGDAGHGVALLDLPMLDPRWTVDLPAPVTRLASGGTVVAVLTDDGPGTGTLRVLR